GWGYGTVKFTPIITGISENEIKTYNYKLEQNYPNPFNPTTKINYQLSMFSNVSLKVYDVLGHEVKTLVNENKPAGRYEVTFNEADFPSGIYFYKLETESYIQTRRMILLK
ncbi:MAG: T9SS type A sorting domain-containing protein, partial [Ignavibacteria bacterium]